MTATKELPIVIEKSRSISSTFFDVPLAKKCYAISQELGGIIDAQITEQCTNKLSTARYGV